MRNLDNPGRRAMLLSWSTFLTALILFVGAAIVTRETPSMQAEHRRVAARWQERQIAKNAARPPVVARPAWRSAPWAMALKEWDHATFHRINHDWDNGEFDRLMPPITWLGDGGVEAALLLALLAWAWFAKRRAWRVTAALGLVGVVLGLAAPLFKMVLPRFRPPALYPYDVVLLAHPLYGGSFPSGHTLTAFTLATILSRRHPWTAPWAFGMATLVGISRISLGVHWLLDVLGGALLGLFFGWIVTTFWSRRERNAARAANRPEPRTSPAANA